MARRRPRRWIRKAILVGSAVLVLVAAVAVARHPWAVAALREGTPSETWPASGRYVEVGGADLPLTVAGARAEATAAFGDEFERSNGAAVVVLRDGEVVHAQFGEGYSAATRFNSFSMSKSLVGLLVLQAVSEGVLPGLDVPVADVWPAAGETEIGPVTLRELLDMRSGISFEREPGATDGTGLSTKERLEGYGPFSPLAQLHVEGVDAVLDDARLVEADRGTFLYQQLNAAILGRVLEERYATPLEQLVDERLARPAGAGGFAWRRYHDDDRVSAYCCIYATALWWARVGQYVLDNGTPDEPFLPEDLHAYALGRDLDDAALRDGEYRTQLRYDILDREGESWQGPFAYFAGLGGQITYLLPDRDVVVVRFGDGYQLLHSTLYEISRFESLG